MQLPLRILFGVAGLLLAPLGFAGVFLPLLLMAFSGVAAALSDAPMIGKFIAYFVLAGTALFVLSRPSV